MSSLLTFLLAFVLTSQALAFAIALISRFWVLRTDPVVLHGIDRARARELVAVYVESVHDTHFGFPTGVFRVQAERGSEGEVVAREVNFSGSSGFRVARFGLAIPALFAAAAADEGCGVGLLALFAGVFVAIFFVLPILAISLIEVVLRALMRSRIVATVEPVPGEQDACAVTFTLSGLSAFGVRRSLLSGLSKPVLPPAWGGSPAESAPEPWHRDRLNVVYAGGSLIAVAVAVAFAAAAPGVGPTTNASFDAPASAGTSEPGGGEGGGTEGSSTGNGEAPTESGESSPSEDGEEGQSSTGEAGASTSGEGASTTGAGSAGANGTAPPAQTIEAHLQRLGEGDYEGAFAEMSAAYRAANPGWVENREQADPMVNVVEVGEPDYGHDAAHVHVEFYARDRHPTPGSDTRCRRFEGEAYLIYREGSWQYEPAGNHYTAIVEPQDDHNCHG